MITIPDGLLSTDWKLCYIKGAWAFFTTQALEKQWGSGWGKLFYEHNAAYPNEPYVHCLENRITKLDEDEWNPDGTPKWRILRVGWHGPFSPPHAEHNNSPYSVQDINAGAIPWLRPEIESKDHGVNIMAGTTLSEFVRLVQCVGGNVYLPLEQNARPQ